jgi:glycosyltransferase involved in cell wall biosynthesis
MKLFGVQVAHGYSSEARVFARMLSRRPPDISAEVLIHDSPDEKSVVRPFSETAQCEMIPFDTNWRDNEIGRRWTADRLMVAARYRRRIPRMVEIAARHVPDVIYSNQQYYDCLAATTIARKLRKPQVIHLHYPVGPWLRKPVLARLLTCDHVVTVSDFIRSEAIRHGVSEDRVTTIRNTIEPMPVVADDVTQTLRREFDLPDDAFVFGMASRIDPGKGHGDSIAAFERVALQMPNARLLVAGEGEIEAEVRAQAAATGVSDRIVFTGFRRDIPLLLSLVNVFLHPSRMDACPLAILEAMASGVPVIAYAEGGALEMILDGKTGHLVPVNDIQGLAAAMTSVYADPVTAREMGLASRSRIATDFRPEVASERFAAVLRTIA